MIDKDTMESAIKKYLPAESQDQISEIVVEIIKVMERGQAFSTSGVPLILNSDSESLLKVAEILRGERIVTKTALIDFGSESQNGDIHIHDLVNGNVINVFVSESGRFTLPHPQETEKQDKTLSLFSHEHLGYLQNLAKVHRHRLYQLEYIQDNPFEIRRMSISRATVVAEMENIKRQLFRIHREIDSYYDNIGEEVVEDAATILIVENELTVARFIQRVLKVEGFNTLLVHNGLDAINLLDKQKVEIVLLDIGLPDISGFEVLEKITERKMYVKVIMVTVVKDIRHVVRCIKRGASDYITKPFPPADLIRAIKYALIFDKD